MANHAEKIEARDVGSGAVALSERAACGDGAAVAVAQPVGEMAALFSMIERAARDTNVDIARMERLFEMRDRMAAQHARQLYLADFSALQLALPAVAKRGTADKTKYARFEDIIDAIREPLAKHGFSLSFRLEHSDKAITVTGILGHRGGHSESTSMHLPPDAGPKRNAVQAWGSAVTYGKRYVAVTLLGIATQDDDDGNRATDASTPVSDDERAAFRFDLQAKNVPEGAVCEMFSVEMLEDLTRKQFDDAVKRLARTKARAK